MKASVVESTGGPFKEKEIAQPTPAANQVLVQIVASGVNPLDNKIRGQAEQARQPLQAILGLDIAGTVQSVGSDDRISPGKEVFGMVGDVGDLQGTLAEFAAVDASLLAHKPKHVSMREAAVMPLVTTTARDGLVDKPKYSRANRC